MTNNEIELLIKAKADEARKEIRELKKEVDLLKNSTKDTNKVTKEQIEVFNSVNARAGKLRATLISLVATYASLEGAKALVEYSSKLEQGFIDIAKTTGLAGEGLKKLENDIYDLTKELSGLDIFSLQEIAKQAGQLGIASNDIKLFTEQIAKISVALDLSAEDASSAMAILSNVFKIPIKDVERLGSTINELSATTTADVDFILNTTKRMAGVGASFGLTADEVMALGATLRDVGVNAELGSTAISELMLKMQNDVSKYAKVAEIEVTEFSALMKKEPIEALKAFLEALGKVDNQSATLKELGLNGSGLSQTMLGLANNTKILTKNLETAKQAYKENTSIADEYAKASDSIKAKQADITNALARLAKELVVELTPAIKDALEATREFIDGLDAKSLADFAKGVIDTSKDVAQFVADNKTLIKTAIELTLAFKALNVVLDMFSKAIGFKGITDLAKGLGLLNKDVATLPRLFAKTDIAIKGLTKRFTALRVASMAFVSTPIGLALMAIAGAVGVMVYKYNEANEALEKHQALMEDSQDSYDGAIDALKEYATLLDKEGNISIDSLEKQAELAEKLKVKLREVNKQRFELDKQNDNGQYDNELDKLEGTAKALEDAIRKVVKVKKEDIEATKAHINSINQEKQAQMELTKEHEKLVNSFINSNAKRLDSAKYTLQQLQVREVEYINKLKQLQAEYDQIKQKYSNERFLVQDEYQSKYNNFIAQGLSEYQKYELEKTNIAKREQQVREALESGNTSLAGALLDKLKSESDNYIQYEINNLTKLNKSRSEVENEYKRLLEQQEQYKLALIQKEEEAELKAHLNKIAQTKAELEATRAQIVAQKELIKLMQEMQSKALGIKIEADYKGFDEAIKNLDKQLYDLENQKKQIGIDLKLNKEELNQLDSIGKEPIIKKVDLDSSEAKSKLNQVDNEASQPIVKKVKVLEEKAQEPTLQQEEVKKVKLELDITQADIQYKAFKDKISTLKAKLTLDTNNIKTPKIKPITMQGVVVLDTKDLIEKIKALNSIVTVSTHKVQIDAKEAFRVIDELKKPTSSIHTVYVKQVRQYATGGFIKRYGALGGYGGGDRIKALLEAGEFVVRKEAVRHYGKDLISALNSLSLPKSKLLSGISLNIPSMSKIINKHSIARLSTGGYIAPSDSTNSTSFTHTTPIVLNIGGTEFEALTSKDVAESLEEYINKYGGL